MPDAPASRSGVASSIADIVFAARRSGSLRRRRATASSVGDSVIRLWELAPTYGKSTRRQGGAAFVAVGSPARSSTASSWASRPPAPAPSADGHQRNRPLESRL